MTVAVLATAGLLAAACGGSSSSSGTSSSAPSGVLTIDNESGGTWTCDFNPFNLSYIGYSLGNVYEPLMFVDTLANAKVSPWLATSYAWSNGNKTLTFTIRKGVKFTNGDPMTPADVVYTFNLLKTHKTLDINSLWSALSSVTASGDNVVMQFKSVAVPNFYYIADQVGIVDQKVWSKIANPVTYPDKNPVGTGAYKVSSSTCTPQNIKYTANPHYWQPGLPKVGTVNYPSFLTNDTANTYLANGQAQWGSQFIPNIHAFYLSKSPNYHYWFPPVANVSMFINLTNPILKNAAVRQAMAYAIDRHKASLIGEYGYEPASNQTGIVTPTFKSWLNQGLAKKVSYNGNESGGPAPYYELRQELYGPNSAPIGKTASSNWERYYNKKVDNLIKAYAATTSSAKQHQIVDQLQAAMVRDVPIIPITEGVDWYQYNTKSISGWVTKQNPYAKPAAYEVPDWGVMLLHLKPKG